jgi:hypothetical protein
VRRTCRIVAALVLAFTALGAAAGGTMASSTVCKEGQAFFTYTNGNSSLQTYLVADGCYNGSTAWTTSLYVGTGGSSGGNNRITSGSAARYNGGPSAQYWFTGQIDLSHYISQMYADGYYNVSSAIKVDANGNWSVISASCGFVSGYGGTCTTRYSAVAVYNVPI